MAKTTKKVASKGKGGRRTIDPATKDAALSDLRAGKTLQEVAAAHGVSVPTLTNWKAAAGLSKPRGSKGRLTAKPITIEDMVAEKARLDEQIKAKLQGEYDQLKEDMGRLLEVAKQYGIKLS